MVRKSKHISIADRLSQMYKNNIQEPPDVLGAVSLQRGLLKQIDDIKFRAVKEALSKYNAENFTPNNISVSVPDATYVAPIPNVTFKTEKAKSRRAIKGSSTPVKSYSGGKANFTTDIYNSYYRNLVAGGSSPNDAKRQATYLTQKTVHETGYGQHIYAQHNYGGHEVPDGKGGVRRLKFNSMDDYTKADIALLDRKWKPWRKAKSEDEFVTSITTDYGSGKYNAVDPQYRDKIKGTSKRVNSYINMGKGRLKYGGTERPKAWLGAAIGAVTSIAGGLLQAKQKRKAEERAAREEAHNNSLKEAASIASAINTNRAYQDAYYRQFRMGYNNGGRIKASFGLAELLPTIGSFAGNLVDDIKKKPVVEDIEETTYRRGGRRRLRDGVSITDGGPVLNLSTGGLYYAGDKVPYGEYVDLGPTHEERNSSGNTGTGWNINGKKIETENKEVEEISPSQMKVYSNSLELPNGLTPAEYVLNGGNKKYAFNTQQVMNGDYGRRTMRNGGHLSRPVGRIKADIGLREILRRGYNTVRDSFIGDIWRLANQDVVNTDGVTGTFIGKDGKVHTVNIPGNQGGAPNVLPGRVGGFRPQNIERGVRTTRNIANVVRQSVRRATPVNASKAATRTPKTVNAPKGDVVNHAKQQVKGYNWLRSEPMQQGYQGAVAGRGTMMGDPYDGQLSIGLGVGDRLRSVINNTPVVPLGIGLGAGVAGGVYSTTDNNDNDNREYLYGQARGNNPAPYDAIQIGAAPDKLNGVKVSTPSIDAAFYTPSRSSNPTISSPSTTRSSGRRRLRNSGRTNIGAFNVPDISNPDSAPVTSPLQLLSDDDKSRLSAIYSEAPTVDTSILSNGVTPKQSVGEGLTTTPGNTTTPFKRYTTSDKIGFGADVIGSLGSTIINSVASNSIKDPVRPVSYTPSKLPTIYNIRPQLDEINRMRNRMLDDSDESSSSVGRLSRRNYINTFATDLENRLWGEKTNKENEMLTRDALNQQQIGQMNVAALNDYYNRLIDTRNRRGIGRAQALQFGLSGLSDAVGNFLDQGRQNYADDQAMKYYAALLGDEGRNWLRRSGVNLRNGGRMRLRNR